MSRNRLTPLLVGECPADWEQPFIDELSELLTNGFVGPSLPHQVDEPANGVRYLQGFNVRPNKLDISRATWVSKEFHKKNSKSQLKAGDLLVVQSGHIGTAAVVPESAAGSNCHALIIVRFKPGTMNPSFVAQYINSDIGQARLRGLKVGSSILHINTSELGKFRIPRPTIEEQGKIAAFAKAWDCAINQTNLLISIKEQKYTHELSRLISLFRHSRTKIGTFAHEVSKRNRGGNDARVLSVTNSSGFTLPEDQFERRIASADLSNYKVVRRGEYAYNPSRLNVGSIARLDEWDAGVLSPMYVVFGLDEAKIDSDYFLHMLNSHEARRRIRNSAQGSVRETVSFKEFAAISLSFPERGVQQRLGWYLNGMREEIALLKKRADMLSTQKRGLMQQLFTGQRRLKVAEAIAA